jgi:hypothetical protein
VSRTVTTLSALAIVLAAPAAPPTESPPAYHPTRLGAERVYQTVYQGRNGEFTLVITSVAEKDSATMVTVTTKQPTTGVLQLHEIVSVSPAGLFTLTVGNRGALDEPSCFLKLPHRNGQRWAMDSSSPNFRTKGTCTAFGPEQVRVPAGTFDAIRVESESQVEGGELRLTTNWFAPVVGMVKMVSKAKGDDREVTFLLKSFTAGKPR